MCLSSSHVFPVSQKESVNDIPSKLFIRSFHSEVKLILEKMRTDCKVRRSNGGAIFFGPSGTGKSWASMAVLVDELREAEVLGKTVVYFDSVGKSAYVFSKERSVLIEPLSNPNVADIPELKARETVLIYDAARGAQDSLTGFPCEYLIFSSPNAGDFKRVATNNVLVTFVCPNWTVEELQMLEHGYGDQISSEEVVRRFERFGGSPRAVVVNPPDISETQERDAGRLLKGVNLWSEPTPMSADWPSSLLKARYRTESTAITPEDAYNKYLEMNVIWEYTSTRAMELVHAKYDQADEAARRTFETWLKSESKAAALHGFWFEHKARSLFPRATADNVDVKALVENKIGDEQQKRDLHAALSMANRRVNWNLPTIAEVRDASLNKKGKKYDMEDLKTLTDSSVLYRLPAGFPLIDYFNPPNNCFSLGVGEHTIHLNQALDLCNKGIPPSQQVNFIFVTTFSNYDKENHWQSFDTGATGIKMLSALPDPRHVRTLARMVQFCMRFK